MDALTSWREHGDAVVQAQVLGELFGFVDEFFERVFGVFGAGELEHFRFLLNW